MSVRKTYLPAVWSSVTGITYCAIKVGRVPRVTAAHATCLWLSGFCAKQGMLPVTKFGFAQLMASFRCQVDKRCLAFNIFDALLPHAVAVAYSGPINATTGHQRTALSVLHRTLRRWQRQGHCWDVFGIFSSWRGDYTNRRVLQPCCYGPEHTVTKCIVLSN